MAPVVAFALAALAAALAGLAGANPPSPPGSGAAPSAHQAHPGPSTARGADFEVDFEATDMAALRLELGQALQGSPGIISAMDFKEKNCFNAVTFSRGDDLVKEVECPVCLEFLSFRNFRKLACAHTLHERCYFRLLRGRFPYNLECPVCKNTGPHLPHVNEDLRDTVLARALLALEAQGFPAGHYPAVAYTFTSQERELHEYLRCFLYATVRIAQHIIEAAIKDAMALDTWIEGINPGILGDDVDVRRQKLNVIRWHADNIYNVVNRDTASPAPKSIELTSQPLSRERTILSLLHILVSVTNPPVIHALSAVERTENLFDPRVNERWKEVISAIRSLVAVVIWETAPSPVTLSENAFFEEMTSNSAAFMIGMSQNSEAAIATISRITKLLEKIHDFPRIRSSIAPLHRREPRLSRETIVKGVADRVEGLFRYSAAIFNSIAHERPSRSDIYFYSNEDRGRKLRELHCLVNQAVRLPGMETIEPVPNLPELFDDEGVREYLKGVQCSLFRSLSAELPTAVPAGYPPLYPGVAKDLFDPEVGERVKDRLEKVQLVMNFVVNKIAGSGLSVPEINRAFSRARMEVVSDLEHFTFGYHNQLAAVVDSAVHFRTPAYERYVELARPDHDTLSPELWF